MLFYIAKFWRNTGGWVDSSYDRNPTYCFNAESDAEALEVFNKYGQGRPKMDFYGEELVRVQVLEKENQVTFLLSSFVTAGRSVEDTISWEEADNFAQKMGFKDIKSYQFLEEQTLPMRMLFLLFKDGRVFREIAKKNGLNITITV